MDHDRAVRQIQCAVQIGLRLDDVRVDGMRHKRRDGGTSSVHNCGSDDTGNRHVRIGPQPINAMVP